MDTPTCFQDLGDRMNGSQTNLTSMSSRSASDIGEDSDQSSHN